MDHSLVTEDRDVARIIIRVEPDGRRVHVDATASAAEWYGVPREAMLGRTPAEIMPPMAALKLQRAIGRCIARRGAVSLRQSHAGNMALRGIRWRLTPSLDATGVVRFIEARLHDEPLALAALRAQHADAVTLLNAMLQISGPGLCLMDDRGCFVQVNEAFSALAGWPRGELIGHSFTRLLPQSERAAAAQWYAGTLLGRGRTHRRRMADLAS